MSAFEERDFPMSKQFICKICGYTTFTRQGMWDHLDKKHPNNAMDAGSVA